MASKSVPQQYRKSYQNLTGGLMSRPNPLMIPATKFSVLQNAILNDHDILEKVQGYILDGSPFPNVTDSFIRMLVNYKVGATVNTLVCAAQDDGNTNATYKVDIKQSYGDGNYNYIGHTVGTALFTHGSETVTGTSTSWTLHLKAGDKIGTGAQPSVWYEIGAVNSDTSITLISNYLETTTTSVAYMARIILSKNNIPVSVVFNNNLIISNGSETPMETNNTSLGKLQSTNWKTVSLLELHKTRVFGANWPGSPSGLIWTYANDETTVDSASLATIFANDNGQIVAIKSFANSLMVLKDNGLVYQVSGEFDQSAQGQPAMIRKIDVPDNLGVIAGRTVCVVANGNGAEGYQDLGSKLYFLSETGIYSINSWMQVTKVSWDIVPNLTNLLLKSTATATKAYSFVSKANWDTGTISALSDTRVTNGISSFFDSLNLSNAMQTSGGVSTFIASNNDVYTAYISSDGTSVRYNHWLASDNSNVDNIVYNMSTVIVAPATLPISPTPEAVVACTIAVAPNGNVGILSKIRSINGSTNGYGSGDQIYIFSEISAGVWSHYLVYAGAVFSDSSGSYYPRYRYDALGLSINYDGSSNPSILMGQSEITSANLTNNQVPAGLGSSYMKRTSGTWGTRYTIGAGLNATCSMYTDSSGNIYLAIANKATTFNPFGPSFQSVTTTNNTVEYWTSTNGGSTWTNTHSITPAGTSVNPGNGSVSVFLNEASNPVVTYNYTVGTGGDVGKTMRYNITSSASSTVDSSTNQLLGYANNSSGEVEYAYELLSGGEERLVFNTIYTTGTATMTNGSPTVVGSGTKWTTWAAVGDLMRITADPEADYATIQSVNSDTSITLTGNYGGTTSTLQAYVIKVTDTVTATGAGILSSSYSTNSNGMTNQSGAVALCGFGLNANEVCIRRVTLFGSWVSPLESDNTLTAWSTLTIGSPITNGNSIIYEVGTYTSSSIPEGNYIDMSPGTIISTNASAIYAKARVTFTLQAFSTAYITSLAMNYVGAGVDAKLPYACVFNNEMYLSVTAPGQAGNNEMIFLDRIGAWGTFTQGSCAMTRYNQQLYIGDSLSGNIYKFRQGYDFNGSAYSLIAETKEDLLGSLELQKEIYKVYVIYQTQAVGTVTFSYRLDNFLTQNGSAWVDTVIDQTQGTVVEISQLLSGQKCTSIQFKIQQNDADVQVGIIGFIVLYDYLNLR